MDDESFVDILQYSFEFRSIVPEIQVFEYKLFFFVKES